MKRFQECNRLGKLWRYRWYLLIPFKWVWMTYINPLKVYKDELDGDTLVHTNSYYNPKGKNLWSLLIGMAQSKMKWYHTMEEMTEFFKKYRDDRNG